MLTFDEERDAAYDAWEREYGLIAAHDGWLLRLWRVCGNKKFSGFTIEAFDLDNGYDVDVCGLLNTQEHDVARAATIALRIMQLYGTTENKREATLWLIQARTKEQQP